MSALTLQEAEGLLADQELSACMQGGLREMRELQQACLGEGIPAAIDLEACKKPGCSPKAQLLVRGDDVPRVAELFRAQWIAQVKALGVDPADLPAPPASEEGELPCPACGTAAPLVEGACSDCGLQLE